MSLEFAKFHREPQIIKYNTQPNSQNNKENSLKKEKQWNSKKKKKETESIHSGNAVILITSDVEPSTGVDESRIPTLKNVIGIGEAAAESVESVAFGVSKSKGKSKRS